MLSLKSIRGWALALSVGVCALAAGPARAQEEKGDPAFIAITGGYFDANKKRDTAVEGRIEWRGADEHKLWIFKPFAGGMATTDGGLYGFAGVLVDIYFGSRFVLTPSVAPGLFHEGDGKDLGHTVIFRTGLEFSYRFDNRARLGIGLSHMSNAGLGDKNPGEETVFATFAWPLDDLF